MATSMFQGFKIKGIDEDRLPPEEERRRRGRYINGQEVVEQPRYTVYILLEPIRSSDDSLLPNIDSETKGIWGRDFNRLMANSFIHWYNEHWKGWHPDEGDEPPSIRLIYRDNDDCGEICAYKTYCEEVKEWLSRSRGSEDELRKLEGYVKMANQNTLRKQG